MSFKMPEVNVGQQVVWFNDKPSGLPHPAFVTSIGADSIGVAIMRGSITSLDIRDSVRHAADPRATDMNNEDGCWVHTAQTLEFDALKETVAHLRKAVEKLMGVGPTNRTGWPKGKKRGRPPKPTADETPLEPAPEPAIAF